MGQQQTSHGSGSDYKLHNATVYTYVHPFSGCHGIHILLGVAMVSTAADSLLVHLNKCHFLLGKVLVCEVLSAGSEDLQTLLLALLLGGVNVKNRSAAVMGQQRGNLPGEFRTGTFGGRNVTAAGGEEEPRQK